MNFISKTITLIKSKEFYLDSLKMYSGYYFSNYIRTYINIKNSSSDIDPTILIVNSLFIEYLAYRTGRNITEYSINLLEQIYNYTMDSLEVFDDSEA